MSKIYFRKTKPYSVECSPHRVAVYPEDWTEDIVETAGFIPLEVRFKQMEQAGYRAQFFESEFTSKDVSDMYLNHPEFDINSEDEIEDVMEKMQLRAAYIEQVKAAVKARNAGIVEQKKESAERDADKKKSDKSDNNAE